jgi:hypothetical protein
MVVDMPFGVPAPRLIPTYDVPPLWTIATAPVSRLPFLRRSKQHALARGYQVSCI